jgi:hypothetical protein
MDFVRLNRVPAETSLVEAFERLQPGKRAVVVGEEEAPYLVTADDLMEACNKAVENNENPALTPVTAARGRGAVIETSSVPMEAFEKSLRRHFEHVFRPFAVDDDRFTVRRIDDGSSFVVTASEFLQLGQSITICTCVGNPVHRFNQAQLRVPGKCNMPHGVKVTCRTI